MQELIWINGEIMPLADARVSIEDRGFQFGDGVYEVIRVYGGRCFALEPHIDRLERSAQGICLELPHAARQLCNDVEKLIGRSGLSDGIVYMQLTRGACARNHLLPAPDSCRPTLLFYTRELPPPAAPGCGNGVALLSVPDVRWRMCWIKSIALLANVLAKDDAAKAGADEAVFVENGIASECCTSNLFAVIDGTLVTHPIGARVLPGITRAYLLECARKLGIPVSERPPSEAEAIAADEVFIASTTREVNWVSRWNVRPVGGKHCGPATEALHRALCERIADETQQAPGA